MSCSTLELKPKQLHLPPPTRAPTETSVFLAPRGQPLTLTLEIVYKRIGAASTWTTTRITGGPTFEVTALAPDAAYEVRVRLIFSAEEVGPLSDATIFSTASLRWEAMEVYRISEGCEGDCEPDYLSDHNTGDLLCVHMPSQHRSRDSPTWHMPSQHRSHTTHRFGNGALAIHQCEPLLQACIVGLKCARSFHPRQCSSKVSQD